MFYSENVSDADDIGSGASQFSETVGIPIFQDAPHADGLGDTATPPWDQ